MKIRVSCQLIYEIPVPLTFLLSVRAQNTAGQKVIHEQFSLSARMPHALLECGAAGTRFDRIEAEVPGVYSIRYKAEVEVRTERLAAEQLGTGGPETFGLDVLPYLYPSRYCQSDRLGCLTLDQFGGQPT
ncbi:MAG: hypothetical protein U0984_03220, partial [Prosthecobacter sp.]|nr:hypothetical protein [Prosthecobacter sp.]